MVFKYFCIILYHCNQYVYTIIFQIAFQYSLLAWIAYANCVMKIDKLVSGYLDLISALILKVHLLSALAISLIATHKIKDIYH